MRVPIMKRKRINPGASDGPSRKKRKLDHKKDVASKGINDTQNKENRFSDISLIKTAVRNCMNLLRELLPSSIRNNSYDIKNRQEAINFLYTKLPELETLLLQRRDLSEQLKEKFQKIVVNHCKIMDLIGHRQNKKTALLFSRMSLNYSEISKSIKDEETAIKEKKSAEAYPNVFFGSINALGDMQEKYDIHSEKYKELEVYRIHLCKALVRFFISNEQYAKAISLILHINENYKFSSIEEEKNSGDSVLQYLLGYCYMKISDLEGAELAFRHGLVCPEIKFVFNEHLKYPTCFEKFIPSVELLEKATKNIFPITLKNCHLEGMSTKYHIYKMIAKVVELQTKTKTKTKEEALQSLLKIIGEMRKAEKALSQDDYPLRCDANIVLLSNLLSLFNHHSSRLDAPESCEKWIDIFFEINERVNVLKHSGYVNNISKELEKDMHAIEKNVCSFAAMQNCANCIVNLFVGNAKKPQAVIHKAFDKLINSYKLLLRLTTNQAVRENIVNQLKAVVEKILELITNKSIRSSVLIQLVIFLRHCMQSHPDFIRQTEPLVFFSVIHLKSNLSDVNPLLLHLVQEQLLLCTADFFCECKNYAEAEKILRTVKNSEDWQFKKVNEQVIKNKIELSRRRIQVLPPPPPSTVDQKQSSMPAKSDFTISI